MITNYNFKTNVVQLNLIFEIMEDFLLLLKLVLLKEAVCSLSRRKMQEAETGRENINIKQILPLF